MDEKNENLYPENKSENPSSKKTLKEKLFLKSLRLRIPKMNGIKIAYALAILLALGGALSARLTANKAIEDLKVTLPKENYTLPIATLNTNEHYETEDPLFEVRQNLTDVPDTRGNEESETDETSVPQTEETTSPYAQPFTGSFVLPLNTDISKDYSPKSPVYNATMGDWRTHSGIDFSGDNGAQIKAISYGKVTKIYDDPLYGTIVEIDHGNEVIAKYCGINKETLEIKVDDIVKAGELIGYLGEIPCEKSEVSHLHFEILYKGKYTDPLEIMNK